MELQIAALKAAVLETNARARAFLAQNRLDAAESSYDTLLLVLNELLVPGAEAARGWQRAALVLAAIGQRIRIDALAPSRMSALQIRANALLDLPDVLSVGGIADVHSVLNAAITVGAPRYNAGDVRGCCTAYWSTALTLVGTTPMRGFPGYARALGQLRAIVEAEVPPLPLDKQGIDELAWTLRRAFDSILAMTA